MTNKKLKIYLSEQMSIDSDSSAAQSPSFCSNYEKH